MMVSACEVWHTVGHTLGRPAGSRTLQPGVQPDSGSSVTPGCSVGAAPLPYMAPRLRSRGMEHGLSWNLVCRVACVDERWRTHPRHSSASTAST